MRIDSPAYDTAFAVPRKGYELLTQQLPLFGRSDFDDEPGKDIIGVVDVRVLLDYIRVSALVADGVEGLSFSDDIDFVARPLQKLAPLHRLLRG